MGSIVASLSLPIKVGWVVWMVWMVSQVVWYVRATTVGASAEAPNPHRPMVNLTFGRERKSKKRRVPDGPLSVTRPPEDLPAF